MKRLMCAFLVFSVVCSLVGCQKEGLPQPDFTLTEDVILAAQEQTGLPGVISESETKSYGEGHMAYVLRNPTETYGNSENKVMTAFVSSAITEGERFMQMYFGASAVPEKPTFKWEDWKQQLEFAALLCGGFAYAEEVYRILSAEDVAGAKLEINDPMMQKRDEDVYEWYVQLPGSYCKVRYYVRLASTGGGPNETGDGSGKMWRGELHIFFYESKALYQERQRKGMEAQKKEQERIAAIKDARPQALKQTAPVSSD